MSDEPKAKKVQKRKSISLSNNTYAKLSQFSQTENRGRSTIVEEALATYFALAEAEPVKMGIDVKKIPLLKTRGSMPPLDFKAPKKFEPKPPTITAPAQPKWPTKSREAPSVPAPARGTPSHPTDF